MSSSSPPPVPTSSQRKECHLARDNYYKCLDEHDKTVGAAGNAESSCKELRKIYEDTCLPSWVKYFERKRAYEKYKAKLQEEGFREEQEK